MCGSRLYSLPSSYESSSVFRAIQFQFNIGAFATFASSSASPPPPLCLSRISPFFLRDTRLFTSILILLKVLSCLLVTISKKKKPRPILKCEKNSSLCTKARGSLLDCENPWWVSWIRRYCIMCKSNTTKSAVGQVLLCT